MFLTVFVVWLVAVVTPGPNFFLVAHKAAGGSRISAVQCVLGLASGTFIWALCGYFGVSMLFRAAPWLYISLKLAGGGYLVWLGLKLLFKKSAASGNGGGSVSDGFIKNFRAGLLTNLSNPKTAAFVTSLFAAALPHGAPLSTGLISTAIMCTVSLAWYSLVAYLFSMERFMRAYKSSRRRMEKAAGVIFIAFGARLALK